MKVKERERGIRREDATIGGAFNFLGLLPYQEYCELLTAPRGPEAQRVFGEACLGASRRPCIASSSKSCRSNRLDRIDYISGTDAASSHVLWVVRGS